ncbi:MAG: hypothetical protein KDK37_01190 [Leptospiraceae bacterium]|nr:hypothetical protein [Leptospiraceae bacterium]
MRKLAFPLLVLLSGLVLYWMGRAFRFYQHPDRVVWMLRADWLSGDRPVDTLILGDSQAMSGLRPDVLGSEFGRIENLGLPSAQPEALLSVLSYLERHRVRTLIVNISPYSMYRTEVYDAFLNYYRSEWISLRWPSPLQTGLYGDSGGEVLSTLMAGLGLYRINGVIRNLSTDETLSMFVQPGPFPGIGAASNPNALALAPRFLESMRTLRLKNGNLQSILSRTNGFWTWRDFRAPGEEQCDAASLKPLPATIRFRPRPQAIEAWIEFLKRASPHADRIFLVIIPFSDSWHETVDRILPSGKVSLTVEKIAERAHVGNLTVVGPPSDFSDKDFYDWNHLDYCGAARYSRWLKQRIAPQKK